MNTRRQPMTFPILIGLLLVICGGVTAIAAAIYVSRSAVSLWALILLGWGVAEIKRYNRSAGWEPAAVGLLMFIMYLAIAAAAYFLKTTVVLWAMLPAGWIAEKIIN